jgi:hypothetical protein
MVWEVVAPPPAKNEDGCAINAGDESYIIGEEDVNHRES